MKAAVEVGPKQWRKDESILSLAQLIARRWWIGLLCTLCKAFCRSFCSLSPWEYLLRQKLDLTCIDNRTIDRDNNVLCREWPPH